MAEAPGFTVIPPPKHKSGFGRALVKRNDPLSHELNKGRLKFFGKSALADFIRQHPEATDDDISLFIDTLNANIGYRTKRKMLRIGDFNGVVADARNRLAGSEPGMFRPTLTRVGYALGGFLNKNAPWSKQSIENDLHKQLVELCAEIEGLRGQMLTAKTDIGALRAQAPSFMQVLGNKVDRDSEATRKEGIRTQQALVRSLAIKENRVYSALGSKMLGDGKVAYKVFTEGRGAQKIIAEQRDAVHAYVRREVTEEAIREAEREARRRRNNPQPVDLEAERAT